MPQKKVSIVVPVFNEASNIHLLLKELERHLDDGKYEFELIFVDDGSADGTLDILQQIIFCEKAVGYISFSRNFGHQSALKAGLDMAKGDCVITMDGDLQHPPALIPALLEKWEQGFDVVYSVQPLYVSIVLGIIFPLLSLAYIPYVVWCVISGHDVAGWASIIIIMFFGGLQMLLLGITGIYIGKIFIQSKQRPGYIISSTNLV